MIEKDILLKIEKLQVNLDRHTILDEIYFSLERKAIGCVLGPSGCGKSTLLRAIAGFQKIHKGSIMLEQRVLSSNMYHVAPETRKIGMVFQDVALFPHLNVFDNVAFGLRQLSMTDRKRRVGEMLSLIGLEKYEKAYPHQLSGGQQQRIALARALAPNPSLLLLDEPFSSLDASLREQLAKEVREVLKETEVTALVVTHDQSEAFVLADYMGVMSRGKLEQWDTAYRVYHFPANKWVAGFVGGGTFLEGIIQKDHIITSEIGNIEAGIQFHYPVGTKISILVRPEEVLIDSASAIQLKVLDKYFRGDNYLYVLEVNSEKKIFASLPKYTDYPVGSCIPVTLDNKHIIIFKED